MSHLRRNVTSMDIAMVGIVWETEERGRLQLHFGRHADMKQFVAAYSEPNALEFFAPDGAATHLRVIAQEPKVSGAFPQTVDIPVERVERGPMSATEMMHLASNALQGRIQVNVVRLTWDDA